MSSKSKDDQIDLSLIALDLDYKNFDHIIKLILSTYCSNMMPGTMVHQFDVAYILGNYLISYNECKLKLSDDEFYREYFYPAISRYFKKYARRLHKNIRSMIDLAIDKIIRESLISKYIVLFIDRDILVSDVLFLFSKYFIKDRRPIKIKDVNKYYESVIEELVMFRLNNTVNTVFNYRFDISILGDIDGEVDFMSSRLKIYEIGYNLYLLNKISGSDTLSTIVSNYNKIKSSVIDNELHVLLFKYLNLSDHDSKLFAIVNVYSDSIDLRFVKDRLPLIYKLLRSIKVSSNNSSISGSTIEAIKSKMIPIFSQKFSFLNISRIDLIKIVNSIINSLCSSLGNGVYVDPITLTEISFDSTSFVSEFVEFIKYIILGEIEETSKWN
ncbi:MAG: hypothetical protein QXD03_01920 [Candidatus Anstonellales archaeon]